MVTLCPKLYDRLRKQPGACGYWDASVASTVNAFVNVGLTVVAIAREPTLMTSDDAFFKSRDSCNLVSIFLTWTFFETALQLWHWGLWDGRLPMMVHHLSAITAWSLYLEGGYGHSLSLFGYICEATNPFMNARYFLETLEMKESSLYMYNGIAFVFTWMLTRIAIAIIGGGWVILRQWDSLAVRRIASHVHAYAHICTCAGTTEGTACTSWPLPLHACLILW